MQMIATCPSVNWNRI